MAEISPNNRKKRFGFDAPKHRPIEESIRWATENGFRYIDFQNLPDTQNPAAGEFSVLDRRVQFA